MNIAVEISLYPLNATYIPPIKDFIARLNQNARLKIITNPMSTQIVGPYEEVFGALHQEMRATFEKEHKAVFVMKVIGPWTEA